MKKERKETNLLIRISKEDKEKLILLSKSTGKSQSNIVIAQIRHYFDTLNKKGMIIDTEEQLIAKNEMAVKNGFNSWYEMQAVLSINWLEQ